MHQRPPHILSSCTRQGAAMVSATHGEAVNTQRSGQDFSPRDEINIGRLLFLTSLSRAVRDICDSSTAQSSQPQVVVCIIGRENAVMIITISEKRSGGFRSFLRIFCIEGGTARQQYPSVCPARRTCHMHRGTSDMFSSKTPRSATISA
jgi:hypothetical protein